MRRLRVVLETPAGDEGGETGVVEVRSKVQLAWSRFNKLTDARNAFWKKPCVYVQADSQGNPIRVGKASGGLNSRYRGGDGYALDAAMHDSGNLVFVAPVPNDLCDAVEKELIWRERDHLVYNNLGKTFPPDERIELEHTGDVPRFSDLSG